MDFWRKRRIGGFTLIEIMVVVLIIGILLLVAIPVFSKSRENARTKTCLKNLRNISDAKDQYTIEQKLSVGDIVEMEDIAAYLKRTPECPSGGTYVLNPVGQKPECTYPGHEL